MWRADSSPTPRTATRRIRRSARSAASLAGPSDSGGGDPPSRLHERVRGGHRLHKSAPEQHRALGEGPLHGPTDGFGLSESRDELRDHFEVSPRHIVVAALHGLAEEGLVEREAVSWALATMREERMSPPSAER